MKPVYITKKFIDHEKTGERVRSARLRKRLTIADVASAAGVSTPYLSYLERGDRAWSEELFDQICAAIQNTGG